MKIKGAYLKKSYSCPREVPITNTHHSSKSQPLTFHGYRIPPCYSSADHQRTIVPCWVTEQRGGHKVSLFSSRKPSDQFVGKVSTGKPGA